MRRQLGRHKSLIPAVLAAALCWILLVGLVYFFTPEGIGTFAVFYLLLFLSTFFTGVIMWRTRRRAFFTAVLVELFFVMRYYGVGNALNLLLLIGFLTTVEIYLSKYK